MMKHLFIQAEMDENILKIVFFVTDILNAGKYMTLPSPRETFRLRGVFYRMFEDRVQALPVR